MKRAELSTAQARWEALDKCRSAVLNVKRECAELTIPSLLPRERVEDRRDLTNISTPYQNLGTRGVNNVANKMSLALFPPRNVFFRLVPKPEIYKELSPEEKGEATEILRDIEEQIAASIERRGVRSVEVFKHLCVTGDCLVYIPLSEEEEGMKMSLYPIDTYVVNRDRQGELLEIVVKEVKALGTIEEDIKIEAGLSLDEADMLENCNIFTYIYLREGKYHKFIEINGVKISNTEEVWDKEELPYIPLTWSLITGNSYGTGLVESILGDLRTYEAFTQMSIEIAAIMSKVLFVVNPGINDPKTLADAKSGDFVTGSAEEIAALQVNKMNDAQMLLHKSDKLERSLAETFMLNSSIRRDAERVTAEEIRLMADELETAFGGVYSVIAEELQTRVVKMFMRKVIAKAGFDASLIDMLEPAIITGMDALGRSREFMSLQTFLQTAFALPGGSNYVDIGEVVSRIATFTGVKSEGILRDKEEVMQEIQQQQQAMAMQEAANTKVADNLTKPTTGG